MPKLYTTKEEEIFRVYGGYPESRKNTSCSVRHFRPFINTNKIDNRGSPEKRNKIYGTANKMYMSSPPLKVSVENRKVTGMLTTTRKRGRNWEDSDIDVPISMQNRNKKKNCLDAAHTSVITTVISTVTEMGIIKMSSMIRNVKNLDIVRKTFGQTILAFPRVTKLKRDAMVDQMQKIVSTVSKVNPKSGRLTRKFSQIVAEEMSNYFPEEEGVMFIVHGENRDEENAERREPVIEKAVSAANAFRPIDQNKNTTMLNVGLCGRLAEYKNKGKNFMLKNTRSEVVVSIRKDKREDFLSKRRKIYVQSEAETVGAVPQPCVLFDADISEIIEVARSRKHEDVLWAIQKARMLCTKPNPPIRGLLSYGILPILVECLYSTDVELVFEASWVLTNIASGNSEETYAVVNAGAVPQLLKLLSNVNPKVCEQALWVLGNIIGDGPHFRDYCLKLGILQPLLAFISPVFPLCLLRQVSRVIMNICLSKEPPLSADIVESILPALTLLVHHEDTHILMNTSWALAYLTAGGTDHIQLIIESGVVPVLVSMLGHSDENVQSGALGALGYIATGSDEQTQIALDCGVLNHISALISPCKERINMEIMWFLSNITAGNQEQIDAVIMAGLIPMIIEVLDKGDFRTQKEAAWALTNLTYSARPDQIEHIVRAGIITPFCALLTGADAQILKVVLNGIKNILMHSGEDTHLICASIEDCGGLQTIENLQNSENVDIYKLTSEIVDTYFSCASDDEGAVSGTQVGFSFNSGSHEWNFLDD